MKFGLQLFNLRDFMQTEDGIRSSLEKVAAMGWKYVQVSGFPYEPKSFKALCDELGLKIVFTHTAADKIMTDTKQVIEDHKILGCDSIGIGGFLGERTLEGARKFLKDFEPAMKMIKENGMQFQYHNHAFEFERFGEKSIFDVLVDESDPELMGFTLDTYWVQYGGKNPVDVINSLKGRIHICHYKDYAMRNDEPRFAPIGAGNLDWDKITAAFEDAGAQYAFVEQDNFYEKDAFEETKISYDFVKQLEK